MSRILAIGDIHGCAKTFQHLLLEILHADKSDMIICLGDFVDRGPDSKGVIDFIVELRDSHYTVVTLRGNHEDLMINSDNSEEGRVRWLVNGGAETLKSFGVTSYADLGSRYKEFFENTSFYFLHGQYIFTHAGLNLKIEDPLSDTTAMMWIRNVKPTPFLDDRVLIHGHTPIRLSEITSQQGVRIINIDGGCVYGGHLVGYCATDSNFYFTQNMDM